MEGNEEADKLAKEACSFSPDTSSTSLAMVRTIIKTKGVKAWNKLIDKVAKKRRLSPHSNYFRDHPYQIRKKLRIPDSTSKAASSVFYQLKLGHGYFNHYLHRFKKREEDYCWCGQSQTPKHLVLECFIYRKHRKKAFEALKDKPPLFSDLFSKTESILAILQLITSTKFSTREWMLYGAEEDEEEEEEDLEERSSHQETEAE